MLSILRRRGGRRKNRDWGFVVENEGEMFLQVRGTKGREEMWMPLLRAMYILSDT